MRQLSSEDYENLLTFRVGLRQFQRWSEAQARDAGLTPAQHQLLLAIKGHRGQRPPAVSDLAGYLLLRHHSTVELVDRAEAAGLVERQGDDRDGRVTRVRLTADGERRLSQLVSAHLDELQHLAPALLQAVDRWNSHALKTAGSPAGLADDAGADYVSAGSVSAGSVSADSVSMGGVSASGVSTGGVSTEDVSTGGDAACWAHLVCLECGAIPSDGGHCRDCPAAVRA